MRGITANKSGKCNLPWPTGIDTVRTVDITSSTKHLLGVKYGAQQFVHMITLHS